MNLHHVYVDSHLRTLYTCGAASWGGWLLSYVNEVNSVLQFIALVGSIVVTGIALYRTFIKK